MRTGNLGAECGVRNAESSASRPERAPSSDLNSFRGTRSVLRIQRGFSLLELMISMFILIILLSVAVPTYQRAVRHARETVLKENLWQMRRAIDQYTADKGKMPKSVDDLVEAKYLNEKPVDPITDKTEWNEVSGDDPNNDGQSGMKDVKSLADGADAEGVEFSKY